MISKIKTEKLNPYLQKLYRISHLLSKVEIFFSMLCLLAVLIITPVQVFARYVIGDSILWSEEMGRYLLVWISFSAVGALVKDELLMSITFVVNKLPLTLHKITTLLTGSLAAGFMLVVLIWGIKLCNNTMYQTAVVSGIPMGLIYSILPIGAFLYIFHWFVKVIELLTNTKDPYLSREVQTINHE